MPITRFVALLMGFLAPAVPAQPATNPPPVTINVQLNHNRMVLPAHINGTPVRLLLDTGNTIPTFHPEVIDGLKLEPSGSIPIAGIAGDERASTYRGVAIHFGEVEYRPRRVASIPSERGESRRRRDGVIGSGFFRQFVVEMDPRAKVVRLHAPATFVYNGSGEIVPFRLRAEIPVVEAAILIPGQPPLVSEYEIDTGCDSGVCLGAKFVRAHKLLESIDSRRGEKFGTGGSVETQMGSLPFLRLGKLEVEKPQTDFFSDGSPVDEPLAGHIGMGVLHRHKVIFDYSRKRMIVEPL